MLLMKMIMSEMKHTWMVLTADGPMQKKRLRNLKTQQ